MIKLETLQIYDWQNNSDLRLRTQYNKSENYIHIGLKKL